MRIISILVAILGIAVIVFGAVFVVQANSAKNEVAASVAPLTLDQINPKYDEVAAKYNAIKAAEEPKIQAGQAAPSVTYDYLSAQRALLGLAKNSIGTAKFAMMSGYVTIIIGLGMVLSSFWMMKKGMNAA